ncbi:hypothetical protein [Microbacterium hominis]|uniref:Nucleotidyl transferase AbiEii/AbiGii toxin family protein n=1 Tax=Microbacterium hominis TaxID=162426 RepID=A0A0B4CQ11_9MICO|nr:hypothetical protein [Microbacterium hominis]KIC58552.1 hypothetical protein RM52_05870 [Microbacterium hominis]
MSAKGLNRADLIEGLRDIIRALENADQPATIQLVGGVAIALTVDADRPATRDIDAIVTPPEQFRAIAAKVGATRGWPDGWLDEGAAIFLPHQFGRGPEWVTLHDENGVVLQAGDPRMLLAMKLVALAARPRRDADDVAVLLSATGVASADAAQEIVEQYFPGDGLPPNVYAIVEALLEQGPRHPRAPDRPDFR